MANNKSKQLKSKLDSLPAFEPSPVLWTEIENRLNFDDKLSEVVSELPNYEPKAELWNIIATKQNYNTSAKSIQFKLHQLIAAASILLVIGLAVYFKTNSRPQFIVETEIQYNESSNELNLNLTEENALELIEKMCANNLPQCSNEIFLEKIGLYNELETEASKLETVIEKLGDSPEIVQSIIQIENMKSQTIQELISLINS